MGAAGIVRNRWRGGGMYSGLCLLFTPIHYSVIRRCRTNLVQVQWAQTNINLAEGADLLVNHGVIYIKYLPITRRNIDWFQYWTGIVSYKYRFSD